MPPHAPTDPSPTAPASIPIPRSQYRYAVPSFRSPQPYLHDTRRAAGAASGGARQRRLAVLPRQQPLPLPPAPVCPARPCCVLPDHRSQLRRKPLRQRAEHAHSAAAAATAAAGSAWRAGGARRLPRARARWPQRPRVPQQRQLLQLLQLLKLQLLVLLLLHVHAFG